MLELDLSLQQRVTEFQMRRDSKFLNLSLPTKLIHNLSLLFSVTKLRAYAEETITLRLPGEMTVFEIDWLSVLDGETGQNFGSVLIPDNLNVPPSLLKVLVSFSMDM